METVENGDKVRDMISGLEGIVVGETTYLNGCVRFIVQPKINKDGKVPDSEWVDSQQIKILEKKAFQKSKEEKATVDIDKTAPSIPVARTSRTGGPNTIPIDRSNPKER